MSTAAQAPWETFAEHRIRCESGEPYNEQFIEKCKEKYKEYMAGDRFVRNESIRLLLLAVPFHYRKTVINA